MKKLLRIIAAALLGAGLVGGVAGASQATIDTTGADSENVVRFEDSVNVGVTANNTTYGTVTNTQDATSGDAAARRNTNAGNVSTGNASNSSNSSANVSSSNSGAGAWANWGGGAGSNSATIRNTGNESNNRVVFQNDHNLVVNTANVTTVTATTTQTANSGDATSSRNTNGGGASTGNASNSSTSSVVISSNN